MGISFRNLWLPRWPKLSAFDLRGYLQIGQALMSGRLHLRWKECPQPRKNATQWTITTAFDHWFLDQCICNSSQFGPNNFPDTPLSSCKFEQFKEIALADLIPITQQLAKKSCNLDPIPAQILTKLLHVLNYVILRIVNSSLETAESPSKLKHAMLNSILKKLNLDHLGFNTFWAFFQP
jgi:hypothetical protein